MGSDPIKLRLELDGLTYVLESWHKKKIRTAILDEIRPEIERLLTDATVIANCINLETLNKAIDNLRGDDE